MNCAGYENGLEDTMQMTDAITFASEGGKEAKTMDHQEATAMMATERYLLGELSQEQREAFEEHLFDCHECVLDMRATAVFVDEVRTQLPAVEAEAARQVAPPLRSAQKVLAEESVFVRWWAALTRPLILAPTFAALLAIVGYQNLVTYPAFEAASSEPRLGLSTTLHSTTRAGRAIVIAAPDQDATVVLHVPQDSVYVRYTYTLYDPSGKQLWAHTVAPAAGDDAARALTFPGGKWKPGTYKLAVAGVTSGGETLPVQESTFELQAGK